MHQNNAGCIQMEYCWCFQGSSEGLEIFYVMRRTTTEKNETEGNLIMKESCPHHGNLQYHWDLCSSHGFRAPMWLRHSTCCEDSAHSDVKMTPCRELQTAHKRWYNILLIAKWHELRMHFNGRALAGCVQGLGFNSQHCKNKQWNN